MLRNAAIALFSLVAVTTWSLAAEPVEPAKLLTGSAFVRELDQPLSISREKVEIRELLSRLSAERNIAIVLDRRIDPGRTVDARLPAMTLRSALEALAGQVDAIVRVVGDTVVVGPDSNVGLLKTICMLRGLELDAFGEALGGRKFQLVRTHTFVWDDLDRPAELVQRIAAQAELHVAGLELIPHDLWAGGVIVEMSAAEALAWTLVQYDLTFEWTETATGVRIVPLSGTVAVTRNHPIRRIAPQEALRRVMERFPEIESTIDGQAIVATGLTEQHDVIAVLARGEDPEASPRTVKFGPLAKRRFTLRVVRQSASAVLQKLLDSEVDIRIDEAALTAANIDLSRKISLETKQATISELLDVICTPIGATFSVDGETVYVPAPE